MTIYNSFILRFFFTTIATMMYRATTGKQVVPIPLDSDKEVEYPSVYFVNKNKPPIHIAITKNEEELNKMRCYIKGSIARADNHLTADEVKSYVASVLIKHEEVNPKEWSSFGVEIAKEKISMSFLNLFDHKEGTWKTPDVSTAEASEKDDLWMVLFLLGISRVNENIKYDGYTTKLYNNLMALVKGLTGKAVVAQGHTSFRVWTMDRDFLKMIAGIDMFYHHFPKSTWAQIRFGTVMSRYRNCTARASLIHLYQETGLKGPEIQSWILSDPIADDYERIMKDGEELNVETSYAPYLSDMGLSVRSPYSATACPSLHTWCHMVGVYLGSVRSQNAKSPGDTAKFVIRANAALMGYALRKNTNIKPAYVDQKPGEAKEKKELTLNTLEVTDLTPKDPPSNDGKAWYDYFDSNGRVLPEKIVTHCNNITRIIDAERKDSLGHWMSQNDI